MAAAVELSVYRANNRTHRNRLPKTGTRYLRREIELIRIHCPTVTPAGQGGNLDLKASFARSSPGSLLSVCFRNCVRCAAP